MALFGILVNPPQGSIENNINNSCFPIHALRALHLYTAKTIPKTKTRGVSAAGKLANNSLQQWNIGKVGI